MTAKTVGRKSATTDRIMEQQLVDLLETKSFAQLTSEQRTMVLLEMSEAEYEMQHELMQQITTESDHEKALIPLPLSQSSAYGTLNQKRAGAGILLLLSPIVNSKVASWQAAAAVVLIAFSFLWFQRPTIETQIVYVPQETVVYDTIASIDTVYQNVDVPVYIDRVKYVDRVVEAPQNGAVTYNSSDVPGPFNPMAKDVATRVELDEFTLHQFSDLEELSTGSSLQEDSLFRAFMVEM